MKKMSINDAAEYLGVSKEAIHNRIRRSSLEAVVEDGVKMVILDSAKTSARTRQPSPKKHSEDADRYYKLLETQNAKLQSRVEVLEGETRSLRDQKELMLVEERKKIEQIYKDKDEQLKNILNTLSSQFMLSLPKEEHEATLDAEIETQVIEEVTVKSSIISLKKYLKSTNFSDKKIGKIRARFDKKAKKDDRITIIGSKYYIDTSKHDYSDLIR